MELHIELKKLLVKLQQNANKYKNSTSPSQVAASNAAGKAEAYANAADQVDLLLKWYAKNE